MFGVDALAELGK